MKPICDKCKKEFKCGLFAVIKGVALYLCNNCRNIEDIPNSDGFITYEFMSLEEFNKKYIEDDMVEVTTYHNNLKQIEKTIINEVPYTLKINGEVIFENKELKPLSKRLQKMFDATL